ncbi:hypothetical protein, partial [Jeotgalibaca porci]|uniref:hypothetical protein n=1 Tax=Jeotgalibaca porci TaxID=1868793 RepID=UPI00359F8E4A
YVGVIVTQTDFGWDTNVSFWMPAHSDSFLRLSAQVMPKNAHSDSFLRLSAQFSPQMALSNHF